ncbi:hypothetical protein [Carnobacterium sp. FSL E2-0243]|uniref:hypothetical protein n=1 Tax=Carnobacterium sp. FSL E2-0243 TaxID=2921365 RepID=UPI0030F9F338
MTNKLEEVFKELQESHVLVDREEYEKLVEKAENTKETEKEAEPKFLVGEYYTIGSSGNNKEIFIVTSTEDKLRAKSYIASSDHFSIMSTELTGNSFVVTDSKLATDEEVNLFKRAEMYHKHNRKLDELKIGDLLIDKGTSCEIYQVEDHHGAVEDIIAGLVVTEIYLTVEEQEEAYKKIVGE